MILAAFILFGFSYIGVFELGAHMGSDHTCDQAELNFKADDAADLDLLGAQPAPGDSGFAFFYGDTLEGPSLASIYVKEGMEQVLLDNKLENAGVCVNAINQRMTHYIIRNLPVSAARPSDSAT